MTRASHDLRWLLALACAAALATAAPALAGATAASAGVARARALLDDGRFPAADSAARALLAATAPAADSLEWADGADLLVEALNREGFWRRRETRDLALAAVRVRERAPVPDTAALATSVQNLAGYVQGLLDYRQARRIGRRALALREAAFGPASLEAAKSLTFLVRSVGDSSYAAALPLAERAVAIREKLLGPSNADLARSLAQLAWVHRQQSDVVNAKALYERAIAMFEATVRPDHPDLGNTLYHCAYTHYLLGEYQAALDLNRRALPIREQALGPDHPDVAWSMHDVGMDYSALGDLESARDHLTRALAAFTRCYGALAAPTINAQVHVANQFVHSGDYTAAIPILDRCVASLDTLGGHDNPELVRPLGFLAQALTLAGERERADDVVQRAVALGFKVCAPNDARLPPTLLTAANVAADRRQFARAESLLSQALQLRRAAGTPESPSDDSYLINLAVCQYEQGRLENARDTFRRVLAIARDGGLEIDEAYACADLSEIESRLGRADTARVLIDRALALSKRLYGPLHPVVGEFQLLLSNVCLRSGDPDGALGAGLEAETIGRAQLVLASRSASERQALDFSAVRLSGLSPVLTLAARGLSGPATARAWDALLHARALVLDETAARHRQVFDLGRRARDLAAVSERLANLMVRGAGDEPLDQYRQQLDRARDDEEAAERALAETSDEFRQRRRAERVDLADVAAAIPEGGALVGFALYDSLLLAPGGPLARSEWTPENAANESYLALVLRAGERVPVCVPLGSRGHIDSLATRFADEIGRGADVPARWLGVERARQAGEALRRAVWDPIAPRIAGARQVFLVPDGVLNLVNFAALPTGSDGWLVESGPLLHVLACERDVVPDAESARVGRGLLALGAPDFEAVPGAVPSHAQVLVSARVPAARVVTRSAPVQCGDFNALRWPPLPETAEESRTIAALWRTAQAGSSSDSSGVELLLGRDASKSAFSLLAPGHRVIHLATHGFFLSARCGLDRHTRPATLAQQRGPGAGGGSNPLLLSGLALAGANRHGASAPGADDGVLTAEEVSGMDLSGTEWAVLSACETGVGEVRAGEGVFGLRRAFQVAGARTVIMSLWSVEDATTRAWMAALYRARFGEHLSTSEAVRAATLAILRERRARGLNTNPFYWGAFVAGGDWR